MLIPGRWGLLNSITQMYFSDPGWLKATGIICLPRNWYTFLKQDNKRQLLLRCNSVLNKKSTYTVNLPNPSQRGMPILSLVKLMFVLVSQHLLDHILSLVIDSKRKRKRPVLLHSPPSGNIKTVPVAPLFFPFRSSPILPRQEPCVLPG